MTNASSGNPARCLHQYAPTTSRHFNIVVAMIIGVTTLVTGAKDPAIAHVTGGKVHQVSAIASSYVVRRGDTLTSISRKLRIAPAVLAARNGISGDRIYAGQLLVTDSSDGAARTSAGGYVVQAGDTLSAVARKLNLNPTALAARNGLLNARVYAGARLLMDRVSIAGRPAAPSSAFVATTPGGNAPVRCPVKGHAEFMNDWGFPRSGGRWHQGTDLMAARGTAVVAPVNGRLALATNDLGGKAVQLRSVDGTIYYFAHLESISAEAGPVTAGSVLGTVGSSGAAEGGPAHLHLEIRPQGGTRLTPFPTVRAACR